LRGWEEQQKLRKLTQQPTNWECKRKPTSHL
jgi:hypothetical protein